MRHHVDSHGNSQYHNVILTWFNLDAVGVGQAEPLFGNFGDFASAFADGVLVIQNVALHLQIWAVSNFHYPTVAQRRDQRLLDDGQALVVWPLNRHRIFDAQQFLLNFALGLALHIFKKEGVKNVHTHQLGSMIAQISIRYPKKLSKEQREMLQKLQEDFGIESKHKDEKYDSVFDKIKSWFI